MKLFNSVGFFVCLFVFKVPMPCQALFLALGRCQEKIAELRGEVRVCLQQTISATSTGHAMGKRGQDGEEWAVVDVVTSPDRSGPLERAGLGGDWKGRRGKNATAIEWTEKPPGKETVKESSAMR